MQTIENITLSEFQDLINHVKLPTKTRLSVTFEDDQSAIEIVKRKRAIEAMKKLKGSGNGNLVSALLKDREKDKLR
jgi:hypothetical protein